MAIESLGTSRRIPVAFLIGAAGVIGTFVIERISHDWLQAGIAGVLISLVLAVIELRQALSDTAASSELLSKQSTERLIKHLRIADAYSHNDWFVEVLTAFLEIKQVAEQQSHDKERFKDTLTHALSRARSEIGTPVHVEIPDEIDRIAKLKEILDGASKYVWAVTFDAHDYLNNFWSKLVVSEYVRTNVAIATRGVQVQRIFVVSQSTLSGGDRERNAKLREIVKALRSTANERLKTYVVSIDRLSAQQREWDTSFLVCDDYAASESDGIRHQKPVSAYISFGEYDAVIKPLRERFEGLRYNAELPAGW